MTTPADMPDDFPHELLAAYVDEELESATHAAVERWLSDHPEAMAEVNAQRELGSANAGLWDRAEPSAIAWATVRAGIERGLNPPTPKPGNQWKVTAWVFGGLASAGVAAAIAWMAFGPVTEQQLVEVATAPIPPVTAPDIAPAPRPVAVPKPDPLAGFAVLPMASDDDVILDRVPDTRAGWLPTGRHPVPDTLALASVEEVHLQEVEPSPIWPAGRPKMTTAPGDAPMIFAAKPR